MRRPLDVRPIKTVLYWQLALSVLAMLIFAGVLGIHGALSAVLGGMINVCGNGAYALMMRWGRRPATPGKTLVHLFRAEAVKITVIALLLVLVLVLYKEVRPVAFFVTFSVTVLAFGAAFAVQKPGNDG